MKAMTQDHPATMSEVSKVVLNYSFFITLSYIVIFALAKLFNLEDKVEIRFVNYIVLFAIAYSALKKIYFLNGEKMEYFSGLSKTFLVCMLGSLWYSILFFIYLKIDTQFTVHLIEQFPGKLIYPALSITAALFSEGFAMSAIIALALLQIFKRKRGRWARE